MVTLFILALMILVPLAGVVLIIGLFRWLMKRNTGYDPTYSDTSLEGHHVYMKQDVNFAQLNDWDHRTGFVDADDERKRKPRKAKATPHYDRLHAQDQTKRRADDAAQRLDSTTDTHQAEAAIPLRELLDQDRHQGQS